MTPWLLQSTAGVVSSARSATAGLPSNEKRLRATDRVCDGMVCWPCSVGNSMDDLVPRFHRTTRACLNQTGAYLRRSFEADCFGRASTRSYFKLICRFCPTASTLAGSSLARFCAVLLSLYRTAKNHPSDTSSLLMYEGNCVSKPFQNFPL